MLTSTALTQTPQEANTGKDDFAYYDEALNVVKVEYPIGWDSTSSLLVEHTRLGDGTSAVTYTYLPIEIAPLGVAQNLMHETPAIAGPCKYTDSNGVVRVDVGGGRTLWLAHEDDFVCLCEPVSDSLGGLMQRCIHTPVDIDTHVGMVWAVSADGWVVFSGDGMLHAYWPGIFSDIPTCAHTDVFLYSPMHAASLWNLQCGSAQPSASGGPGLPLFRGMPYTQWVTTDAGWREYVDAWPDAHLVAKVCDGVVVQK